MGANQISPLAPFSGGTGPMYGSPGNPVLRPLTPQEEFGGFSNAIAKDVKQFGDPFLGSASPNFPTGQDLIKTLSGPPNANSTGKSG